ncbi:MAG TPA: alpha/beta hydrolase [Geodermatophilus sp.]|nr:alpha/beta hydrolase [Geodermatophilus sp.]
MAVTESAGGLEFRGVRRVAVNGTPLAYREVGAGEPVVFVHGGVSDLRTWERQLSPVGERYRAIAYSRRYARPNDDIPPGALDPMDPHVDDLVAFLRAIGAAPAHLVGNSWGAFICLLTAIRHPDVVRSLVLEEPPLLPLVLGPGIRPHPGVLGRSLARHPRATLAVLMFGARTFAPMAMAYRRGDTALAWQIFARGVLGADTFAGLPAQRRQQMRENASVLRAELRAGFPPLPEPAVRTVQAPALLLTGKRSPAVVRLLSGRLAELLPGVEQVQVPEASHLMHEDNAPFVNGAILRFVARRASPSEPR